MARLVILLVILSILTAIDTALTKTSWIIPFNTSFVPLVTALREAVPWLTGFMALLTYLGSDPVLFLIAVAVAVRLVQQRLKHEAIWLLGAAIFTRIFGIASKLIIQSPRPDLIPPPPYIHVSLDYGFPSGHALMSTVILGSVAILAVRYAANRRTGVIVALFCALLIFGIGISRVYLGVHWPNDILGGHLYGACILTCAQIIRKRADSLRTCEKISPQSRRGR